jgi:hypothetical protein
MRPPLLLLLPLLLAPTATCMAVRPKLSQCRPGPNLQPPPRADATTPPGARDVVVRCYDISTPELCTAMSLLAFKQAYWFPKLSIAVGSRTWSYDGEPEQTYDAIIENAAGGPPLRTWNLGPTSKTDAEIDSIIAGMAESDYAPEEYDFFLRNCNHFCLDLSERLAADGAWSAADAAFMDENIIHESEAILNSMPGGAFQQSMTRAVTRQVQKIIIKSWRKEWKRALAEYEEEQGIPLSERV